MKLYGSSGRGGSSLRPLWVFSETEAPVLFVPINMQTNERREEPYIKLNPNGQVPTLVDGDFVLTESLAINFYIAKKFKPDLLGTTDEEEATVWRWSLWAILNPQRYFLDLAFEIAWAKTNNEAVINKANTELERFLKIFDDYMEGKTYVVGEKFTVADINVATSISYASHTEYDFSRFKNITRWLEFVTSRPAYKIAKGE